MLSNWLAEPLTPFLRSFRRIVYWIMPDAAPPEEIDTPTAQEEIEDASQDAAKTLADEGDPVPDFLAALDVIPDDVALVGTTDDALISYLDDLGDDALREIASQLGDGVQPAPRAIAREIVKRFLDEGAEERLAQLLDEAIALPPGIEGMDGPVLNLLAREGVEALRELLLARLS